jgi:hypothetical protein
MYRSHRKAKIQEFTEDKKLLKSIVMSFWLPPQTKCPKCGSELTEYYDPFFFAPIRTLQGKRRIKCRACRFVWRLSRDGKSVFDMINPF